MTRPTIAGPAAPDNGTTPHRVAILGGGIAALTTAYWLTRPELDGRYEVTVHQLGWRLGGKLASSREGTAQRNLEHGLHVWFGCYDNAFAMAEDVYEQFPRPAGFPWKDAEDAFLPQSFTPIGQVIDGKRTFWPMQWPKTPGSPGDGTGIPEAAVVLGRIAAAVLRALERLIADHGADPGPAPQVPAATLTKAGLTKAGLTKAGLTAAGLPGAGVPDAGVGATHPDARIEDWLAWLEGRVSAGDLDNPWLYEVVTAVHRVLVPRLDQAVTARPAGDAPAAAIRNGVDAYHLRNIVDIGLAVVAGLLDPADGLTRDFDLDRIDDREFRQWLIDHGARRDVAEQWSFLTALYDTMFQYEEGDHDRPNYAAGTALRAFLRIALTYKGAVLHLVKAGMGEVIIAPMYELLRARGVRFEFFHRVRRLELSDDRSEVARVHIDVQAQLRDPETPYPATFVTPDGLVAWHAQPVWDALVDGDALRDAKVDFESRWGQPPPAAVMTLERGREFDTVVLGIALGGFMPIGDDDGLCAELAAANPAWQAMTDHLGLVPSISAQLWMNPTLEQLGWDQGKPAAVGWTTPHQVWADMTQVLDAESWGEDAPGSLHYFCGVLATDLYRRPADDTGVPAAALQLAHDRTVEQFDRDARAIWPVAVRADGTFDWELLHDPEERPGVDRLDAQYLRANVTPTECCVGSTAGSTGYRLRADESGFSNLVLCGAWTRTPLNSTCVEAAVMSGMAAARAIAGFPIEIVGEGFLGPPPPTLLTAIDARSTPPARPQPTVVAATPAEPAGPRGEDLVDGMGRTPSDAPMDARNRP